MIITHLLPAHFSPEQLSGGVAVVIDILRATSTICTAIANRAETVIPCEQVDQALQLRREIGNSATILGGERKGVLIDGFDFGNSPRDYSVKNVEGKTILFTTTNGTRAIHRCEQAKEILIGSFLNFDAITKHLCQQPEPIHLVCAGTDGNITVEDCLFAGAVIERIIHRHKKQPVHYNDTTQLCLALYHHYITDFEEKSEQIAEGFESTLGGNNLLQLGMKDDLVRCAQLSSLDVVPRWDPRTNQIKS